MIKIFLKLFYDGTRYYGFQRQPNVKTVEGELLKVLNDMTLVRGYEASGRTDRGVHAIGQTVSITLDHYIDIGYLIKSLNDNLPPDIIIWAYRISNGEWHARYSAVYRTYLYLDKEDKSVLERLNPVLKLFTGTHDFTCYSIVEKWQDRYRRIIKFNVYSYRDLIVYEIQGDTFLRQMVRRIIAAVRMYVNNNITLEDLSKALKGGCKYIRRLKPVPPWNTVLLNVRYPFSFIPYSNGVEKVIEYLNDFKMGDLSEFFLQMFSSRLYELL